MRLLFSTLSAGLVGLVAGFGWQWKPVAGPLAIAQRRALDGVSAEHARQGEAAERFLAALQKKGDSLRMEHDLWLAVQSLGTDDLGVVSADWAGVMALVERFDGIPQTTRDAVLAAVVEKWLTLDPRGAMARLGGLSRTMKDGDYIPAEVIAVLAKKQPQALYEFVMAQKDGPRRNSLAYQAAVALASQHYKLSEALIALLPEDNRRYLISAVECARAAVEPEFGLARAAQPDWDGNRGALLWHAGKSLAKRGPDAVADALARNPQWSRSERERFFNGLIVENPAGAAQILAEMPADSWGALTIKNVAARLAGRDTERAMVWSAKLTGEQRVIAEREVAVALGRTDPAAALAMLNGPWVQGDNEPRSLIFEQWLMSDETAVRAWLNAHPSGDTAAIARATLIQQLARSRRTDEATRMLTGDEPKIFQLVADAYAKDDVLAAADWAAALPAGAAQNAALRTVVSQYASDDIDAAEQWVTAFPAGSARDNAARALVENLTLKQPGKAAEWVEQIDDRWQKTRSAVSLFYGWRWRDQAAAENWLRTVPGIYEVVRTERLSGL